MSAYPNPELLFIIIWSVVDRYLSNHHQRQLQHRHCLIQHHHIPTTTIQAFVPTVSDFLIYTKFMLMNVHFSWNHTKPLQRLERHLHVGASQHHYRQQFSNNTEFYSRHNGELHRA
jgi:hypothetical protein